MGPPPEHGPQGHVRRRGRVSSYVAAEFPGLGVSWIEVEAAVGRSPESVRGRLRALSDRFYGSHAVQMRQQPIPWAYRVFFRHVGLDPDVSRTPIEQLALERLRDGAFLSRGLPADALTIATVETGVALRAFDADRLAGPLGIRESVQGESLPGGAGELPHESLVLTDDLGPVGLLFGATSAEREVGASTRRTAVAAVEVSGVAEIAIEEALWIAASELLQA
jgi:DNA/RNA-binding domain of Phe-tRNA-synthetase-like protein